MPVQSFFQPDCHHPVKQDRMNAAHKPSKATMCIYTSTTTDKKKGYTTEKALVKTLGDLG